jgi:hypothetical protein
MTERAFRSSVSHLLAKRAEVGIGVWIPHKCHGLERVLICHFILDPQKYAYQDLLSCVQSEGKDQVRLRSRLAFYRQRIVSKRALQVQSAFPLVDGLHVAAFSFHTLQRTIDATLVQWPAADRTDFILFL